MVDIACYVSENFVTPASRNFVFEPALALGVYCCCFNLISVLYFSVVRWSGLEFGRGKPTRSRS